MPLRLCHLPDSPHDYALTRDAETIGLLMRAGAEYVRGGAWAPDLGTEAGIAEARRFPDNLDAGELLLAACDAAGIDVNAVEPEPNDDLVLLMVVTRATVIKARRDRLTAGIGAPADEFGQW